MPPAETSSPPIRRPNAIDLRLAISRLHDLPGWFPTVKRVLKLAVDPRVDPFQIQVGLSVEPAVTNLVLKLANSAFCGTGTHSNTVPEAIGAFEHSKFRSLLRTVFVFGFLDSLSKGVPAAAELREKSLAAGVAAFGVAEQSRCADPLDFLNTGLLHNVGELAVAKLYPENYGQAEEVALSAPRAAAERRAIGFEFRVAGRWLVEGWAFPRIYAEIVEHWQDPFARAVETEYRRQLCAIQISVRLAEGHLESHELADIPIDPNVLRDSGLAHSELASVWQRLPQDIENLRAVISEESVEQGTPEEESQESG